MVKINNSKQQDREKRLRVLVSKKNKFAFCVVCLEVLPILKTVDVEFRHDSTPAGDLCPACKAELKKNKPREETENLL